MPHNTKPDSDALKTRKTYQLSMSTSRPSDYVWKLDTHLVQVKLCSYHFVQITAPEHQLKLDTNGGTTGGAKKLVYYFPENAPFIVEHSRESDTSPLPEAKNTRSPIAKSQTPLYKPLNLLPYHQPSEKSIHTYTHTYTTLSNQ
jgi:hypothetical protein